MIHWAPLHLKFLVLVAPLPSAGKRLPNFTVFIKLVLPLQTLFSAIEVVGHILVILEVFMKSLFHAQAIVASLVFGIHFPPWTRGCQLTHCPCFLFVFAPSLPFGGRAYKWLGRRFVCKEFLANRRGRCSRASRFSIMARRNSSRSHEEAHEHSSSNRYRSCSRLDIRTPW